MSNLLTAVETIRNEFAKRFAVAPSIRLSVSSSTKMTEEDATKIVEEVANELRLSTPERGSRNGTHWVSAERWTPSIVLTVFYDKQEESRCSQCPWKETK